MKNIKQTIKLMKNKLENLLDGNSSKVEKLSTILEVYKWELDVNENEFVVGEKLTFKGGDYKIPQGEYELSDGKLIQIDASGIIVAINDVVKTEVKEVVKETETEVEVEVEKEVEAEKEKVELKEQVVSLSETVADLNSKLEDNSKPLIEANKTINDNKVLMLAKVEEIDALKNTVKELETKLSEVTAKPILDSNSKKTDLSSYAVKMKEQIKAMRK